jgi:non-specific serine/threonine protein kinase
MPVAALLAACPDLTVLVTSRSVLRISGEHAEAIRPLGLPDESGRTSPDEIAGAEAVRLFVARARAAQPDFALTNTNSNAVAAICRCLDGLPLAIELAAAKLRLLPPEALLTRLARTLPLLTGGGRDLPVRQQTMRDAIAWSYELLTDAERVVFRRLAVFVGGFTLDAAAAVAESPGGDAFAGVESLVDQSLLHQVSAAPNEPRFGMLETVREFGLEQLEASDEAGAVHARHAAFFAALAEVARASMLMNQAAELERLRPEDGNLLAALAWLERSADPAPFVGFAAALLDYWFVQSRYGEGRRWLERASALSERTSVELQARARTATGLVAIMQGDYAGAEEHYTAAIVHWAQVDDPAGLSMAVGHYGLLAYRQGAYAEARERLERALALSQGADPADAAVKVNHIEQVLMLGDTAAAAGDLAEAAARYEEVAELARTDAFDWYLSDMLPGLGNVALLRGDVDRAEALYRDALPVAERFGDTARLAGALVGLAAVAAARGQAELAAQRIGAAEARYEIAGTAPFRRDERVFEGARAAARRTLGEDRYREERELGRTESLELITANPDTAAALAPGSPLGADHGLTAREVEVVRLIAAGLSNAAIADTLFLSVPTVKRHLTNILGKLELPSRSALNTWAHVHGLT